MPLRALSLFFCEVVPPSQAAVCAKLDLDHTEFLDSVWAMVCSGNVSAVPDEIAFLHMSRAALDIKCHSCKYTRDKSVTLQIKLLASQGLHVNNNDDNNDTVNEASATIERYIYQSPGIYLNL